MACPRCRLRFSQSPNQSFIRIPSRRAFHTSPKYQRLGAFTYAQEWQTGTYSFNKAHTKTLPIATRHTDTLLSQWATQSLKKRRPTEDADAAADRIRLRNSIAAQRRKTDRVFISRSSAKDFGDRVVVSAFVYDGEAAEEMEQERRRKARMGVKADGGEGGRRRGPVRRGAQGGGGGAGRSGGFGRAAGVPGTRRIGGAAATGAATGFRRVNLGGNAGGSGTRGPPRSASGVRSMGLREAMGGAGSRGPPRS